MAAIDYEKEYDNRARVPEHPRIFAQWIADAAAFRAKVPPSRRERLKYGPTPREIYDLFRALPETADPSGHPLAVFIHGGWWRNFDAATFSHMAAGLNGRGIDVAVAGYNLCPQVTISDIIAEMRRALLDLWGRYRKRMLVFGHSAGGHLTAAMMATDWPALDRSAPADLVPAGYSISGVFDLEPLIRISINKDLRLDSESALAASPIRWPPPRGAHFDAVVGGLESSEFLRQSRDIADVWGRSGVRTRYEEIAGANHFDVLDALTDPGSAMVARLVELVPRA